MRTPNRAGRFLCRCGVHAYLPDVKAGYPYKTCERCGKMSIHRPTLASEIAFGRF